MASTNSHIADNSVNIIYYGGINYERYMACIGISRVRSGHVVHRYPHSQDSASYHVVWSSSCGSSFHKDQEPPLPNLESYVEESVLRITQRPVAKVVRETGKVLPKVKRILRANLDKTLTSILPVM